MRDTHSEPLFGMAMAEGDELEDTGPQKGEVFVPPFKPFASGFLNSLRAFDGFQRGSVFEDYLSDLTVVGGERCPENEMLENGPTTSRLQASRI
jgi:hypothetical protein